MTDRAWFSRALGHETDLIYSLTLEIHTRQWKS